VVALSLAAACAGGSTPGAGGPVTWTGARALTATEDAPSGVATDGARVLFTTGRTQVGENALRVAEVDGGAASTVVAVDPGGLIPNGRVALDGEVAYVAAGNGIVRQPLAGGVGTIVVDGRPALVDEVVVAGDHLWWTTYQYGEPDRIEVARMPKAGGAVEVVAAGVARGFDNLHPDGDAALVASPQGVLRVRAGQPPETVVSGEAVGGVVTRLAVDDRRIYVLTTGAHYRLMAVPREGGAAVVLADDVDSDADLAVVGDQVVFFRLVGGVGSGGRAELQAVPGGGGPVRRVASGAYPDGDLAPVGDGRVVFSADRRVWVASVNG